MAKAQLVAVSCRISQGVVSSEKAFDLTLSDGSEHSSVAPTHYFWTQAGKPLRADEPLNDEEIKGMIAARLLEKRDGSALVAIPDGEVVWARANEITSRPTEVILNVPVGSGS